MSHLLYHHLAVVLIGALLGPFYATASDRSWDFSGALTREAVTRQVQEGQAVQAFSPTGNGLSGLALSMTQLSVFNDWYSTFGIRLSGKQMQQALTNFKQNMAFIYSFNSNNSKTYWLSPNQFAHLNSSEFSASYLMLSRGSADAVQHRSSVHQHSFPTVCPGHESVDWVSLGKVSAIQDQLQCGSSWAMAATAAVESAYVISFPSLNASSINLR